MKHTVALGQLAKDRRLVLMLLLVPASLLVGAGELQAARLEKVSFQRSAEALYCRYHLDGPVDPARVGIEMGGARVKVVLEGVSFPAKKLWPDPGDQMIKGSYVVQPDEEVPRTVHALRFDKGVSIPADRLRVRREGSTLVVAVPRPGRQLPASFSDEPAAGGASSRESGETGRKEGAGEELKALLAEVLDKEEVEAALPAKRAGNDSKPPADEPAGPQQGDGDKAADDPSEKVSTGASQETTSGSGGPDRNESPAASGGKERDLPSLGFKAIGGFTVTVGAILLLALVVWLFRRGRPFGGRQGRIRVVERQSLGGRLQIVLVEVDGHRFLLGTSDREVTFLHPLDDKAPTGEQAGAGRGAEKQAPSGTDPDRPHEDEQDAPGGKKSSGFRGFGLLGKAGRRPFIELLERAARGSAADEVDQEQEGEQDEDDDEMEPAHERTAGAGGETGADNGLQGRLRRLRTV